MANKYYTPMWVKLKAEEVIVVQVTLSEDSEIQSRLVRTLRKAIQKEKYKDTNFRSLYPHAKVTSTVEATVPPQVKFTLDKGMGTCTDQSIQTIFGGI